MQKRNAGWSASILCAETKSNCNVKSPALEKASRTEHPNFKGRATRPQNWTQYFVSEKPEEANSLKGFGEPGRTRTYNPLIKSQLLYH